MTERLRAIKPIPLSGISPNTITSSPPKFESVDPATLVVECDYQRNLSERSYRMIRQIIRNWDWARMKPPVCARDKSGKLFVVDGQHTAIAAASHPAIGNIPVMVVDMETTQDRASAFIGHNKDRLALTNLHMYYAALAAGDIVAVGVDKACRASGVTIHRGPPSCGQYEPGETISVNTIENIVKQKGAPGATRVLKLLVAAKRCPLVAPEIRAVAELLFNKRYTGMIDAFDLETVIRSKTQREWWRLAEAKGQQGSSRWRTLAALWAKALGVQAK